MTDVFFIVGEESIKWFSSERESFYIYNVPLGSFMHRRSQRYVREEEGGNGNWCDVPRFGCDKDPCNSFYPHSMERADRSGKVELSPFWFRLWWFKEVKINRRQWRPILYAKIIKRRAVSGQLQLESHHAGLLDVEAFPAKSTSSRISNDSSTKGLQDLNGQTICLFTTAEPKVKEFFSL